MALSLLIGRASGVLLSTHGSTILEQYQETLNRVEAELTAIKGVLAEIRREGNNPPPTNRSIRPS